MDKFIKNKVVLACSNSVSMRDAAKNANIPYASFIRYAKILGCHKPNQGLKGYKRGPNSSRIQLIDILLGKYPHVQSNRLKLKLFEEGKRTKKCERCGITEWQGGIIVFELHHINGDCHNHVESNIEIICPNCHSQTPTFRFKKRA